MTLLLFVFTVEIIITVFLVYLSNIVAECHFVKK